MSKKSNSRSNHRNDEELWDDRPRHRVKAIRQNKDAKRIERALKRRDYKALAEEYM